MFDIRATAANQREHHAAIQARLAPPDGNFTPFRATFRGRSIGERFHDVAQRQGDHPAVVDGGETLSYRGLDEKADQVAGALRGLGAKSVALVLDNGIPMVSGMLGAIKAGVIFVPLDPLFPLERLRHMVDHSDASVVLTSAKHALLARELAGGRPVVDIDRLQVGAIDLPAVGPDDLAYIVYTSGSTGEPKGIVHNHRNVLHCISNYTDAFRIGSADRLSLLHSASFSSGIVDILLALLNGASLHVWDFKARGFGGLVAWFDAQQITVLDWVPTPFRHLLAVLEPDQRLASVRLLVLASEPVTQRDHDGYMAHFSPECVMVNRLGTTEAYNFRMFFLDRNSKPAGVVPAGYEVPDKEVVLLGADRSAIHEPGVAGEIGVRSEYLAVGYWNRPELTEEKFRPDPDGGARRTYLTGDVGLFRPDGCLEYLGREDDQVKVRGYRVETSEIEMALMEGGEFHNVVVAAPEAGVGERRLVAYLVPSTDSPPSPAELRDRLASRLPDYMVPTAFITVDELPTTPSGKIARADLPLPEAGDDYEEPSTDTEQVLAAMWCELLGLDRVGRADRLMDLGGHSLLVARLFERIERRFDRRLALSTMFEAPTLAELAEVVDRGDGGRSWSPLVPIQPEGGRPPLYFVHAHLGNVVGFYDLAHRLGPDQPFYGLQAEGLDDGAKAVDDLDEMTSRYVAAVRRAQPRGPYLLGGFCFGGAVAYEMARQLEAAGEEVLLVVMVEGHSDRYPQYPDRGLLRRMAEEVADRATLEAVMFKERGDRAVAHLMGRVSRVRDIAMAATEKWMDRLRSRERAHTGAYHAQLLAAAHSRAYRSHAFKPYPGPVLLLRAGWQPTGALPDPTLGWGDLVTGPLEVREIPGPWIGMLSEPRVDITARHIRAALDRSLSSSG